MLPKSVSPRFIWFAAFPVFVLLLIPLLPLERALIKLLALHQDRWGGILVMPVLLLSVLLVRKAFPSLGIRVRSRSVDRYASSDRDDQYVGAVELPIRFHQGERLFRVMAVAFLLAGLVCCVLAWFLPVRGHEEPWMNTVAMLSLAVCLTILGILMMRAGPPTVCEISDEGIRAPDGFWGRQTFVPWGDLVRCEIIRDDENWCDHFLLWDRKGRLRFRRSRNWMGQLRRSERTRVFRALRARFPQKAKPDQDPGPALAGSASSAVWDRELDG